MKRPICLLLVLTVLLSMSACRNNTSIQDPVMLYYLAKENVADSDGNVLAYEIISGVHSSHVSMLLPAYLQGPLDPALESPFPTGTHLLNLQISDDLLVVTLSQEFSVLTGISLSLACCALAKTVMEFSGVKTVQIQTLSGTLDGDDYIIIHEEDILFYDNHIANTTDTTE